jgi:DNA-binding transcriptional LysR family regulator
MKLLEEGEIHIGIESAGHKWSEKKILIDKSKICLISREKISWEDLPNQNLISITTPSIKKVFTNWWPGRFTTEPIFTMETDYVETCKRMVLNGLGVAFVPAFCLEQNDPLHILELDEITNEEYRLESWMNYRESTMELSVVREFIKFMMNRI